LQYAADLINKVVDGFDNIRTGIHVCRGNWSRNEETLLTGDYLPLLPAFTQMNVNQFVLEFATPRAGEIDIIGKALAHKELGLGVINPRTDDIESTDFIIDKVEMALKYFAPEKIFLNTDCGFGCFAERCVNDEQNAYQKIKSMVDAAEILRKKYSAIKLTP
jgi:5-methyltetrahydropteroyltriglutamate--homocysteine methyltransferase